MVCCHSQECFKEKRKTNQTRKTLNLITVEWEWKKLLAFDPGTFIRSFRCTGTDKEQITSPVNTLSIDPKQTEQHFVLNDFHLKDLQNNKMAVKKALSMREDSVS